MGELLIVLENEYKLYQELLKLLQKEQELLVSGKGGTELLSILEVLERLISEVQDLKTTKRKFVENLSISYSIPVSDISLTRLCEVAEAPDAKKLLDIQVKMVDIRERVKGLNVCISYLSEKALEYSTNLIKLVLSEANVMFGASEGTYHPNGRLRQSEVRWDCNLPPAFISRRV